MPTFYKNKFLVVFLIAMVFLTVRFIETLGQAQNIVNIVTHKTFAEVVVNSSECLLQHKIPLAYCNPNPGPVEDTSIGDLGQTLIANMWTYLTSSPIDKQWLTQLNITATYLSFLLLGWLLLLFGFRWTTIPLFLFGAYWLRHEHFGVDYRSMALAITNIGLAGMLALALGFAGSTRRKLFIFLLISLCLLFWAATLRQPLGIAAIVGAMTLVTLNWLRRERRWRLKPLMLHVVIMLLTISTYFFKDTLVLARNKFFDLQGVGYLASHGTGHTMIVGLGVETINPWGLRSLFSDSDYEYIGRKRGIGPLLFTPSAHEIFHKIYFKMLTFEPLVYASSVLQKIKATAFMANQLLNPFYYSLIIVLLFLTAVTYAKNLNDLRFCTCVAVFIALLIYSYGQGFLAASEYAYVAESGFIMCAMMLLELLFTRELNLTFTNKLKSRTIKNHKLMLVCTSFVLLLVVSFVSLRSQFAEREDDLIRAAGNGDIERFEKIIEQNGWQSFDQRNYLDYTPLMKAAANGQIAMMKYLLQHGADPNSANLFKVTPLMQAVWYGHEDAVDLLLSHQADIQAQSVGEYNTYCFARDKKLRDRLRDMGLNTSREYCRIRTVNYREILR